jgi:hypothetical protein
LKNFPPRVDCRAKLQANQAVSRTAFVVRMYDPGIISGMRTHGPIRNSLALIPFVFLISLRFAFLYLDRCCFHGNHCPSIFLTSVDTPFILNFFPDSPDNAITNAWQRHPCMFSFVDWQILRFPEIYKIMVAFLKIFV